MKCSNYDDIVKAVKHHEQKELTKALEAWGGAFNFEECSATDCPIIAVNMNNMDPEPMDVLVKSAQLDKDGYITLQCTGKLDGEEYEVDPNDVFAGHLDFVISAIPETDSVKDVSIPFKYPL